MIKTDKLKRAALDTALENAEELLNGDADMLALSAGMVAGFTKGMLTDAMRAFQLIVLESASEADKAATFNELMGDKMLESSEFEQLYNALQFLSLFAVRHAEEAARGAINKTTSNAERFGRN
jgi:hypothetical protein